ncbi:MAG: exodeoxyribonuclease III [Anaerolineales bacterium]|jgi:exodeoxyribonuclease-3|nr:exodeoxyribonuclease III [Anaerolineales bacterium]
MKITTWNVNGLRAVLGKGFLDWAQTELPDVLCLQEIKARPAQLEAGHLQALEAAFPQIAWNPAERPGYSGVATFARLPAVETRLGLGREEFDREGRAITSIYPGFHLFNLYFPNGQDDLKRVPFKLDFYAHLLEMCDSLHAAGEGIIITGDFNTAHRPIDLRNPKENEKNTGFLPEERAWVDRYLEHGFVDIFRQLYPERVQYTWWTYRMNARIRNVGWRLDYFLVSRALVERVQDVIIHDEVMGSDHCPVSLVLKD